MIDDITGLPLLPSDIYQIPLNTDAIPYNDLQAEARLPRQPMLPDDIIPTIALTTGLRSDGTGEVVHTDDKHAAKVYVVNQPVSSGGGNSSPFLDPQFNYGPSYGVFPTASEFEGPGQMEAGTERIIEIRATAGLDPASGFGALDPGHHTVWVELGKRHVGALFYLGLIHLYYNPTTPALSHMIDTYHGYWPQGIDLTKIGWNAGELASLFFKASTVANYLTFSFITG